jgi:CheY-like chemotaxis protein
MARVLIVDDDPNMCELIELALAGQGPVVVIDSVESGRAALERLAQHAYDLVVCDLHMPDRDGPAVYRAVARRPPPWPAFLFITGYADAGPYETFIKAAQVPVLAKPFELAVLREMVSRLLSGT